MRVILVLFLTFQVSTFLLGQPGERVEVVKDYKADIPETPRIELNPNLLPADTSSRRQEFRLMTRPYKVSYLTPVIRPMRLPASPDLKRFPGFLSLGFGLLKNREIKGSYALAAGANTMINLDLNHRGISNSKQITHQQYNATKAGAGLDFLSKAGYTLSTQWHFGQENRYFYGYHGYNKEKNLSRDYDANRVSRRFHDYGGHLSFYNHQPTAGQLDYKATLQVDAFRDNLNQRQVGLRTDLSLSRNMGDLGRLKVAFRAESSGFRDAADTSQRLGIYLFHPSWSLQTGRLMLEAGAKLGLQNTKWVLLPSLESSFAVVPDKLAIYLTAQGDVVQQNFQSLASENPYLANRLRVTNSMGNTYTTGLKGSGSAGSYRIEGGIEMQDNLALYITTADSIPRFLVQYDRARIGFIRGEFTLSQGENLVIRGAFQQRFFRLDRESRPWHIPSFTAMSGLKYKFQKPALAITTELNAERGVPYPGGDGTLSLGPLIEWNLGASYQIHKQADAFLQGNNLLNNRRQRWKYYDSIGINFLAGIRLHF